MDLAWERSCLARMRRGEREAFGELYRAFAPKLYREVLMPKLGHAHAAQDALAETFASFLEHHGTLEVREQSLMAWLARVASNNAVDAQRKRARTLKLVQSARDSEPPQQGADAALEARQLQEQSSREVARVLGEINPRYARALQLRFFEERSREQCAELLEVKVATFDVLLLRALRAFRQAFELAVEARRAQGGES